MRLPIAILLPAFIAAAPLIAAEPVALAPFRGVSLNGGGDVVITPGPVQRVTIVEGSSAISHLRVTRGGDLRIDNCRRSCPRNYRLRVIVQTPRAPDVAIAGGGVIAAKPGFRGQARLSAAITGGGRIDMRALEAADVSAAVVGGGEILVRARSSLSAAIRGGGLVRYLGNPQVSSAVSGGGQIKRGG